MRQEHIDRTETGADERCRGVAMAVMRFMDELEFTENDAAETLTLLAMLCHDAYGIAKLEAKTKEIEMQLNITVKEEGE